MAQVDAIDRQPDSPLTDLRWRARVELAYGRPGAAREILGDPIAAPVSAEQWRQGLLWIQILDELEAPDAAEHARVHLRRHLGETHVRNQHRFVPYAHLEAIRVAAPLLDADELSQHRERLRGATSGRLELDAATAWVITEAGFANDAAGARAALDEAPAGLNQLGDVVAHVWLGRLYLLAERYAEARRHLTIGVGTCLRLDVPLAVARADLWLGDAHAGLGDHAAACQAWRSLEERWHDGEPRGSRTLAAVRERLSGCRD